MAKSKKPSTLARSRRATRRGTTRIGKSTKIASMTVLLRRIKGASIGELCKHTGWQPHSVRAVISSVIKKRLGLDVVSEKVDGVRVYRIVV